MKIIKTILILLYISIQLFPQTITWKNITSNYTLPNGIQIFEGSRQSPILKIYYADVDLNNTNISVRPYISGTNYSVDVFNDKVGAYVSVNGGFFGGNVSYSSVIYPNEVKANNVISVTRNSKAYPVIRSLFSMRTDRTFSVDWIYHFGSTINDIYKFNSPLPYINNDPNPLPTPQQSNGEKITNLLAGIGGAPVLIKSGVINITYNEEVMWGSGVGFDNRDPRTAVGYTNNKHVILLVADGRSSQSEGVSLPELAQIMFDLGCYEAMNLDGGGSTQMAIGKSYVNTPAGIRPVPTILSVVHTDSLTNNPKPAFEKIIDTEDNSVLKVGSWTESANSGFYGTSKSLIITKGNGNNYIKYKLGLPKEDKYEISAWWVSASNRATNTPYIINHKVKADTIRVDQTKNGSSWQKLGVFTFTADSNTFVQISDAATNGTYVVADAIKISSVQNPTNIETEANSFPTTFYLSQNYPNPFNSTTVISYRLSLNSKVSLKIYDLLGCEVAVLVDEYKNSGIYNSQFSIPNSQFSSGTYFYRLTVGSYSMVKKMVYLK